MDGGCENEKGQYELYDSYSAKVDIKVYHDGIIQIVWFPDPKTETETVSVRNDVATTTKSTGNVRVRESSSGIHDELNHK
jgi:hypothetical protein